jgi:hypothetical protein
MSFNVDLKSDTKTAILIDSADNNLLINEIAQSNIVSSTSNGNAEISLNTTGTDCTAATHTNNNEIISMPLTNKTNNDNNNESPDNSSVNLNMVSSNVLSTVLEQFQSLISEKNEKSNFRFSKH